MNKALIITISLALLASSGMAIYDPNSTTNTSEGDLRILDSSESPVNFSQENATCGAGNGNTTVDSTVNDGEASVTVEGNFETPNPCHELEHSFKETEEGFLLNVTDHSTASICEQCIGQIKYTAELDMPENATLTVTHNNDEQTVHRPEEDQAEETEGFFSVILSFFGF